MLFKPVHKSEHTSLRRPRQISVINILQPKASSLSRSPLEICTHHVSNHSHQPRQSNTKLTVKDRPPPSPSNINPIIHNRRQDIIQITLIIIRPPQIPQYSLQTRKLRLKRLREPKLRNLDIRHAREQILRDLPQEPADALGRVVQPAGARVGCGTRWEAIWSGLRAAGAFGEAWRGGVADAGVEVVDAVGVVGGVGVNGEEVAGAFDEVFFGLGEGWEDVAQGVFQGLGVVAVVPLRKLWLGHL
jgi:hypothetical protein